jgi:hypothetical protein
MFQSYDYEYMSDCGFEQFLYKITIVDPDFGKEVVVKEPVSEWASVEERTIAVVIKLYSDKGHSINQIAKNLWLLFGFNQIHFLWKIEEQIEWCLENLPEYLTYHETVQMLMLFS